MHTQIEMTVHFYRASNAISVAFCIFTGNNESTTTTSKIVSKVLQLRQIPIQIGCSAVFLSCMAVDAKIEPMTFFQGITTTKAPRKERE